VFIVATSVAAMSACADTIAPRATVDHVGIDPGLIVLAAGDSTAFTTSALGPAGEALDATVVVAARDAATVVVRGSYVIAQGTGSTTVVAETADARDSVFVAVPPSGGAALALVDAGDDVRVAADGDSVVVLLSLIAPPDAPAQFASLDATISWDASRLAYRASSSATAGWFWLANEDDTASGTLSFASFSIDGSTTPVRVARLVFDRVPADADDTAIVLSDVNTGTPAGIDVSSSIIVVPTIVRSR
jgi:hypothetical protein